MDYKIYVEAQKLWEQNNEDISSNKHGGNSESKQAHKRIGSRKEQQRLEVLEVISRYPDGLSMKEVAHMMGVGFNVVSGRGSELKALGRVEKTGEIRDGSAVLRAVPVSADEFIRILNGVEPEY